MSLKLSKKSLDRRFLPGLLALIFLLTMALSDVTLSEEKQAGKQNVLRQASLEWMQVGLQQYRSNQFADAEKSFRRALVFRKYLTDAERLKINKFLVKARIDSSEGKQAVAKAQSAKAEEKVKSSEPLAVKGQQQTVKKPKTINSRIEQKVQSVKTAEPSVAKIQLAAESSQDVIVVEDKSFRSKYMRLSAWLSLNRRNVLMIGLPALAVLVLISKLQGIRKRPGRRIYANYVPASTSYIGSKLNGGGGNIRAIKKGSRKGRLAFAAAASPERKSFEQSTEHWKKKHVGHAPVADKPVRTDEKWPQREEKLQAADSAVAKAGQKQCRKCEETKAHSDFHKNKSSKDGLASWCKECKKQSRKK